MAVRLRSRADLKAAGEAFAHEAAEALSAAILTCPDAERTEEYVNCLQATALNAMASVAQSYRNAGIPGLWVAKFRSAWLRTFRDDVHRMSLAALAGGQPN